MTHLEVNNLASDYLEGLLEPARQAEVEAHLAECSACRELIADVRGVIELCHSAEELEPAPWLVSKILLATVGERRPTLREQLITFFRPAMQPRFAYAVAMAVFSFSIIVNAAGIDLRNVRVADLNPRTWFYRANRAGHVLYARAEKFYYDLRVVYEIESRFRQLRSQPKEEEKEAPKQEPPAGGSTDSAPPGSSQLAFNPGRLLAASAPLRITPKWTGKDSPTVGAGRSPSQ
jgi:hypothetical protein